MRLPFVSRRRYDDDLAELAGLRRRIVATEKRHDEAEEERRRAVDELAAASIVNVCLTEDLAKAREQLAAYGGRRTVSNVLEEHDVHRKALADALGEQKYHLNWDQLIAEAARLTKACEEWMADHTTAVERADRLQAELDDARLLAARLTAAVETRQAFDDQGRPVDAAPPVRRDAGSARLRRERALVRKLEQRLSEMQLSHVADTRELHDLRQKGATS
ncbi:hypothetical protein ACIA6D_23240 [Streptomyces cacaoi]